MQTTHSNRVLMAITAIAVAIAFGRIFVTTPSLHWHDPDETKPFGGDFIQEWAGADMLRSEQGRDLYDLKAFAAWQHSPERLGFAWDKHGFYPPVYPPPYYWLLRPFSLLNYRAAVWVWMALIVLAYPVAVYIIENYCVSPSTSRTRLAIFFWSVFVLFPPLYEGWRAGQKGSLWLLLLALSVAACRAKRPFVAGLLLSIFTLKPTLFLLAPLAALRTRWIALGGMTLGFGLLWGICFLTTPWEAWSGFIDVVRGTGEYQHNTWYRPDWSCSLLTITHSVNRAGGWPWAALVTVPIVALMGYGLLFDRGLKELKPESVFRWLVAAGLVAPHFYHYDVAWLALPLRLMLGARPARSIWYLLALWMATRYAKPFFDAAGMPLLALCHVALLIDLILLSQRRSKGAAEAHPPVGDVAAAG